MKSCCIPAQGFHTNQTSAFNLCPTLYRPTLLNHDHASSLYSPQLPRNHVTRSSSGLGRATALAFAAYSASPIICSDIRTSPRGTWCVSEATIPSPHPRVNLPALWRKQGNICPSRCHVSVGYGNVDTKAIEVGGRLDL